MGLTVSGNPKVFSSVMLIVFTIISGLGILFCFYEIWTLTVEKGVTENFYNLLIVSILSLLYFLSTLSFSAYVLKLSSDKKRNASSRVVGVIIAVSCLSLIAIWALGNGNRAFGYLSLFGFITLWCVISLSVRHRKIEKISRLGIYRIH